MCIQLWRTKANNGERSVARSNEDEFEIFEQIFGVIAGGKFLGKEVGISVLDISLGTMVD